MARVLIIGDTHCPGMRTGYVDFLKRVADDYAVTRVVHIGDLVDWASISYHEKSPCLRNATQEYAKARKQVAALARAFPKVDWLIGNHDALTERQAVTAGLPPELLRDYTDMWEVGWAIHPRYSKLLIDGVVYAHGDSGRGGQDAAFQQAKDNFRSTVIGHFHNQAGVRWWANPEFRVFGLSVGCGIDGSRMQFEYGRRFAHNPILGCGVVLNGKHAYFEPWLLRSRQLFAKLLAINQETLCPNPAGLIAKTVKLVPTSVPTADGATSVVAVRLGKDDSTLVGDLPSVVAPSSFIKPSPGSEMLALSVERTRIAVCEVQQFDGPPLIYVAGPYSEPDPILNTHRIVRIADRLLDAGFVPLVPHLSVAWHLISPKPYQTWLEYDQHILARCDAVLRVPGDSKGAEAEARHAIDLGIPVIHPRSAHPADCVAAVANWFQRSRAT